MHTHTEVKHGQKSLINIISTFEMKMMLSEVFDVLSKDLQEVLVQVQVSAKEEGLQRDVPQGRIHVWSESAPAPPFDR